MTSTTATFAGAAQGLYALSTLIPPRSCPAGALPSRTTASGSFCQGHRFAGLRPPLTAPLAVVAPR